MSSLQAPLAFPRVLVAHNRYLQHGGEDGLVGNQIALVQQCGGYAAPHLTDSHDEQAMASLKTHPWNLVFNREVYGSVRARIRAEQIDVVHCHNLFPLLSTSVYAAARDEGVPVVQSAHNFRTACLNGLHLRAGQACHQCHAGFHLPAVINACYRGSHTQSAALGVAQTVNKWRGAWHIPAVYLVQSPAMIDDVVSWGVARERITIMPPWLNLDPGPRNAPGEYAMYLGRLSPEKGVRVLLDAWTPDLGKLVVAGDGPERARLAERIRVERLDHIALVGFQTPSQVSALLMRASMLVMPSMSPESFGLVVMEAYAHQVPVIASAIGALPHIVHQGQTGLLVPPGDAAALRQAAHQLVSDPALLRRLAVAARAEYEQQYTVQAGARRLHAVYAQALATQAA